MQKIYKYLLIFIVGLVSLFSGCRTAKVPVSQNESAIKPVWTSEQDKLRSTVLLIEASRQKNLGNWQQATVLYHDATQADPGNDAAYYELARIHAMQGQYDDALSFIRKAIGISPGNHHYQTTLADIYILSNRLTEAIAVYEQLIQIHPENPEYAYNLASAYLYNKEPGKALNMFVLLENLVGFSEEVSIEKQKIFVEQKQYDKAIEEAKKLVSYFPDDLVYYEVLADLYRETGQLQEAGKMYEAMLKADPGNPLAQLLMADYLLETGDKQGGYALLEQAFSSPELDLDGKIRIVYRYFLLSETGSQYLEQGMKLSRMLIGMHPDEPEPYLIHGDLLSNNGQPEEARATYLKAIEMDPSNLSVWQQLLSIDGQLSDFTAMRDHSDRALEYFFEQPVLFLFNGLACLQLQDYESAASSLEYGLIMSDTNQELKVDFLSLLGDAYHYLEQHERSDGFYDEALEISPENATVLNNYSYHLSVRKERLDEALSMSERALESDNENTAFLDTYGWILYQMGRYEEAREWIGRSVQLATEPSAAVLEHYGDVLYKLGMTDEALNYWGKAREAGDGSGFLDKKIKDKTLYE